METNNITTVCVWRKAKHSPLQGPSPTFSHILTFEFLLATPKAIFKNSLINICFSSQGSPASIMTIPTTDNLQSLPTISTVFSKAEIWPVA